MPALCAVEAAVNAGLYAAGFLSYEAAPAFDDALITRPAGPLPVLWFGLYEHVVRQATPSEFADHPYVPLAWHPSITRAEYRQAFNKIQEYISAGDTYQVNYTLRLRAAFHDNPRLLFQQLCRAQWSPYCAYLDMGDHVVCSASPELFFRLARNTITCRPMKGTMPRGLSHAADETLATTLRHSPKTQAENLMIVDMVRNDLGRIAVPGSVQVTDLFTAERYETLWQMTSTVTAVTPSPVSEIFTALFPCASITGAPKVRTMEIISELETTPRGIYTGCVGYLAPGRDAQFNVAIRTVHLDRTTGQAEYGTGGGIIWDSTAGDEYEECLTKTDLTHPATCFSTIGNAALETERWLLPVTPAFTPAGSFRKLFQLRRRYATGSGSPVSSSSNFPKLRATCAPAGCPGRRHNARCRTAATKSQLERAACRPARG